MRRWLWGALLSTVVLGASAEVVLTNPGLPERETLAYTETTGPVTVTVVSTVTHTGKGANERYDYRYKSPSLDALFRLAPSNLLSLSSDQLTRGPDSTVRRTADYQDLVLTPGKDDLPVTDVGCLMVTLRGFPFETTRFARIQFVGQTSIGTMVTLEVRVEGRDSITTAGRTWNCYHLTSGLGGALSFFVPKTDWWFAVDGSHPLIKFAGPVAGFGSATKTLLLQEWTEKRP